MRYINVFVLSQTISCQLCRLHYYGLTHLSRGMLSSLVAAESMFSEVNTKLSFASFTRINNWVSIKYFNPFFFNYLVQIGTHQATSCTNMPFTGECCETLCCSNMSRKIKSDRIWWTCCGDSVAATKIFTKHCPVHTRRFTKRSHVSLQRVAATSRPTRTRSDLSPRLVANCRLVCSDFYDHQKLHFEPR